MKLSEILEAMTGPEFYNDLISGKFQDTSEFEVRIPVKLDNKKVDLHIPVSFSTQKLEKEVKQYLEAPPEMKEKFKAYAYWYDNFNKLIFSSMNEADACLFLAACAYCSANTALDQNILEAAKLFTAVSTDFKKSNGKEMLEYLSTHVKGTAKPEELALLQKFDGKSAYADLLVPKKDYKGGKVTTGVKKGQDDIFSEVTVSNAKIPNFNLFIKYYLAKGGAVTRDQLFDDYKNGRLEIGGTKISSFFMNLIFPGIKWEGKIDPATVDRWMIRVFFDKPLADMVEQDLIDWVMELSSREQVKAGKKDTEDTIKAKREKIVKANKEGIINDAVMQLFGNDVVRQNLVKILHEAGQRMGLTSYQLQALAWVHIRQEYNEPAAKFTKFEDVMEYAQEAAEGIMELDPNINKIVNTIKILSSGPRFKFKDKQDVVNTILNKDNYEKIYFLPPKEKAGERAKQVQHWEQMRVALNGNSVDIFDKAISTKKPVYHIDGQSKREVLKSALQWVMTYKPATTPIAESDSPSYDLQKEFNKFKTGVTPKQFLNGKGGENLTPEQREEAEYIAQMLMDEWP